MGCDGAHSLVRKLAGIGFPGVTSAEVTRIGRVTLPTAMIVAGTGEVDVPGVGRLRPAEQVKTTGGSYSLAPLASLDAAAAPDAYIVSTREHCPDVDLDRAHDAGRAQRERPSRHRRRPADDRAAVADPDRRQQPPGRPVPGGPGPARRRRGARLRRGRVTQRRPARRPEPRLEARRAGQRRGPGWPAGQLPR